MCKIYQFYIRKILYINNTRKSLKRGYKLFLSKLHTSHYCSEWYNFNKHSRRFFKGALYFLFCIRVLMALVSCWLEILFSRIIAKSLEMSSTLRLVPVLRKILLRWALTVCCVMKSESAICFVDFPLRVSRVTWISRSVRSKFCLFIMSSISILTLKHRICKKH